MTSSLAGRPAPTDRVPAWTLALSSIVILQLGAALSPRLMDQVGAAGTVWLRMTIGAVVFVAAARPRLRSYTWRELQGPVLLGLVTAGMTLAFLEAILRLPLGTTVAIEFLGPLGVGVLRGRDRRDLVWPVLALVGVLALTRPWTGEISVSGVLFALAAAVGWAAYILLTQHVGDRFSGLEGLAVSIPVAAVATAFVGVPAAWGNLTWSTLVLALVIALLMPVVPFALELLALRRLTAASFGTLMALEPAVATFWGAVLLSQVPDPLQVVGVAFVVAAGIGAERTGHRDPGEAAHFEAPGTS